jgi:hypothetical protein
MVDNIEVNLILKKLNFYKTLRKPIYFKVRTKEGNDFRNGVILEICDDALIMNEVVMGQALIMFEEIIPSSISESKHHKFKKKEEGVV